MAMARGHSSTMLAVLCILSFFAGRFMGIPGLPDAGRGPTIHRAGSGGGPTARKVLLESQQLPHNVPDVQAILPRQGRRNPGDPPMIFPPEGFSSFEELVEASGMLADRPPIPTGVTGHPFYVVQPMQLLSWYPRAYLLPKLLDKERCDHIIKIAERRLAPSGLALKPGETMEHNVNVRTSQGTFMGRNDDPDGVLAYLEDKIAVVTGIPAGHGEAFNILRYQHGQHYDSHYDAFPEKDYGKQSSQRIATVLVYLTDVEEGGETSFLLEGKDGLKRLDAPGFDYTKCDKGIKVKPRAGDALLFWSMNPDGSIDKHSLHGGCPVTGIHATKYTATRWIRNKCLNDQLPCVGKPGAAMD